MAGNVAVGGLTALSPGFVAVGEGPGPSSPFPTHPEHPGRQGPVAGGFPQLVPPTSVRRAVPVLPRRQAASRLGRARGPRGPVGPVPVGRALSGRAGLPCSAQGPAVPGWR